VRILADDSTLEVIRDIALVTLLAITVSQIT